MNGERGPWSSPAAAAGPSARPAQHRSSSGLSSSSRRSGPSPDPLTPARSAQVSSPDQQGVDLSTRPALARRTTETPAALSVDLTLVDDRPAGEGLRRRSTVDTGKGKERELSSPTGDTADVIEVLIHELSPTDTLPRIALLYGIDLAILRKTNKLWTSDSLHVRKTVFIPLSACHLREELIRGPADDEVTLLQSPPPVAPGPPNNGSRRQTGPPSHHARAATTPNLATEAEPDNPWLLDGADHSTSDARFAEALAHLAPPLSTSASNGASPSASSRPSTAPTTPDPPQSPRPTRVVKVARMGRKELSFFPRSAPSSARASLDSSLLHLQRPPPSRRSPSATTSPSLSRKLSNLFLDVPSLLPPSSPSPLSPSSTTLLGNGRPSSYARMRSASDFGRATPPPRDSIELDSPEAEHVELARLSSPSSSRRQPDWFSPPPAQAQRAPGVIRQQVAPKKPMMVVQDGKQGADRRVGDGLGDGRIKDVWIG